MINSNNENQDKLTKVTYQTHGTCSKYICISVDEDGDCAGCPVHRWLRWQHQGRLCLDSGHEGKGSHCPTEGYHLWQQAYKLSRPAGYSLAGNGILRVF